MAQPLLDSEHNHPYPLPKDLGAIDRLDLQHYAIQQATQERYHVPLSTPKNIIDIGAGSGAWILEMAKEFPESEITGIDITPLRPSTTLPANCKFEVGNVLEGLPHADGTFDYVRQCLLVTALANEKWQPHVVECARICASGGWVEMSETNCALYGGGSAWQRLNGMISKAFLSRGLNPEKTETLEELMREAGLVDITAKKYEIPVGSRGGKAGELFLTNIRMGTLALVPLYKSVFGMSQEDVEQLLAQMDEEIEQHEVHVVLRIFAGRKP
ncbi:S-adenosyl-L-methionine-dependent methyltransferase [Thamnocephalis sphaerospora]|uniref:S-adenosyl-L-methionine-dependent methyltransferase n=1 Tax=Thamnocephalis sphaerospora TaxID=78915 RepID=A0A4V1IWH6_9FUNG|nr:S-adenosyl-L-methionine-dependent methyltransferase [Thamnocephalis sphaerospora]|eukprot:RKP07589.1 S-adenosyl-L-methionine-dependent methyltransferase [Thamnocephalis sphaerospora]